MAATRHNLSRRAVLGAGVGACALAQEAAAAPFGVRPLLSLPKGLSDPCPSSSAEPEGRAALRQDGGVGTAPGSSQPCRGHGGSSMGERSEGDALSAERWNRTLAAYRRAEARVAAFKV